MIRALIGTVAVLAGFAVVERSVDASTGQGGKCTPTDAYALLPHGEAVPVRADPTTDSPSVGILQGRTAVSVFGSRGGWARISVADGTQLHGWMPIDRLRVDARSGNALGDTAGFRILGCRGNWLQVINARNGAVWIDSRKL
jgi:hypothetical protein